MSQISGLLNQTADISHKSYFDDYGKTVYSPEQSVACRFQHKTRRRLLPNGSIQTIEAIAYVPATTFVEVDDKLVYLDQTYKVTSKEDAVDATGRVDHIKLELAKWQT